jgi:hypothetical protein
MSQLDKIELKLNKILNNIFCADISKIILDKLEIYKFDKKIIKIEKKYDIIYKQLDAQILSMISAAEFRKIHYFFTNTHKVHKKNIPDDKYISSLQFEIMFFLKFKGYDYIEEQREYMFNGIKCFYRLKHNKELEDRDNQLG